MNNQAYTQALQAATKKKFRGHENLYSKHVLHFAMSAEREYQRLMSAYISLAKQTMSSRLPEIVKLIQREQAPDTRHDDTFDFQLLLDEIFKKVRDELFIKTSQTDLRKKLESFALMTQKLTIREWQKAVKATLGIDIFEDYYNGDFFRQQTEEWISQNVNRIQSIPQEAVTHMKETIMSGFRQGQTAAVIAKQIQEHFNKDRRKALFLARDQIGTLQSQLTKFQQEDAGVSEYIWSSSGDSRVRSGHRKLNGKKFSWSSRPEDPDTKRKCHPGEDYGCRCVALPVFNFSTIFQESRLWKVEARIK